MSLASKNIPIKKEIAQQMVAAYAKEAAKNPKSYTKAIWFPIDQILDIAERLKENKADGLRIYLAQYTSDLAKTSTDEYEGRNTVLLVPTNNINGEHVDDTDNIENRGNLCPDMCEGTEL
ncbi:hypothetical protein [Pedobacter mucosus]|uniref:hypothetical protein n=1 Tax=Pedobacter mucosus TaxID=2895286 RepID=UPI001EE426C6|nr:hypothetical protein [Pedobacter mucosus]UKT63856.1 hypothetical protein LOK61_19050 [Pedobacter mucosus]